MPTTIQLSGRIDTNNAAEAEERIIAGAGDGRDIVLDASDLEYISSAGLRMVMRLAKRFDGLSVTEASPEVFEVFQMTGIDRILPIAKRLREISLEGCEVIGRGGHGTVYRLDEETIAKVYRPGTPLETVEHEVKNAKDALVAGVPTAISYDIVRADGDYAIVFELVNPVALSFSLAAHPERERDYARAYADLLKVMNSTELDPAEYDSLKQSYLDYCESDITKAALTDEERAALRAVIESIPDRRTMVHGDYHPGNVMLQGDEPLLIDMAEISYGHPIFDLLSAYLMLGIPNDDITMPSLGLTAEQCRRFWQTFLEEYFGTDDPAAIERLGNLIAGYALVKMALVGNIGASREPEYYRAVMRTAMERLSPIADRLIGALEHLPI